jgi:hypothetical protein
MLLLLTLVPDGLNENNEPGGGGGGAGTVVEHGVMPPNPETKEGALVVVVAGIENDGDVGL